MQQTLKTPIAFHCHERIGTTYEEWDGYIKRIHNYGSHHEIQVDSRSGLLFIVGRYVAGAFISIPAFEVGCDLASYGDYFWNKESLAKLMNPVDAATIAEALRTLSKNDIL